MLDLTVRVGVGGQGELSFDQDQLVAGASLGALNSGTQYREVCQFCSSSVPVLATTLYPSTSSSVFTQSTVRTSWRSCDLELPLT